MKGANTLNRPDEAIENESFVGHPWLSVIIPVFNAETFISRCINSILSQGFTDYELILVDDGSQDESPNICRQYSEKDGRIRYFRKLNGGSYQARLYGVEQSKGQYITFCDADDYYYSNTAFVILHQAAEEAKCDVLQFEYIKKYNHLLRRSNRVSQRLLVEGEAYRTGEYPKLLCSFWDSSHITPNVWNKVYIRKLFAALPPYASAERVFWGDDLIMNLALLKDASSVLFLPENLYVYQQGSGGTSGFSVRTMDDLNVIKQYQMKYLSAWPDHGDNDKIESVLHSETAGWLLLWVRQAIQKMDEQEVCLILERVLNLPGFSSANRYYSLHLSDETVPATLLRMADPKLYVEYASKMNRDEKKSVKRIIRDHLKTVLVRI